MKIRANILSGEPGDKLDWVGGLDKPVPVFHTGLNRFVGTASEYERQGEDLWAILDLEEGVPRPARFVGFLRFDTAPPSLIAVVGTDLSREEITTLVASQRSGKLS